MSRLPLSGPTVGSDSRRSVSQRRTVQPAEDRPRPTQGVDPRRQQERRNRLAAIFRRPES